jgi:hypothetical protein
MDHLKRKASARSISIVVLRGSGSCGWALGCLKADELDLNIVGAERRVAIKAGGTTDNSYRDLRGLLEICHMIKIPHLPRVMTRSCLHNGNLLRRSLLIGKVWEQRVSSEFDNNISSGHTLHRDGGDVEYGRTAGW